MNDTGSIFNNFLTDLKIDIPDYNIDEEVKNIEDHFYPEVLKILQKDETFFDSPRIFCKVDLSEIWKSEGSDHDLIWKQLHGCIFASFLHGDIKEKLSKILDTVKGLWNSSGQQNDEITRILNDEQSEGHFQEIINFLSETRIAKLCMELFEEIDFEDMASDLNFENPNELIEMLKNPENPVMKRIIGRIQGKLQQKMERGEFTQQQIVGEIEAIKLKIQGLFGNVFNEMLGGRRAEVPSAVLMGNTPEARRQRMLARLQKKHRDKNSH